MTKKILWVDDKINDYKPFVEGLRRDNLLVVTADRVDSALTLAASGEHKIDLFIVDLRMPDKSGFDAIAPLRKIAPDTPICILSSYLHLEEYRKKLNEFGRSGLRIAVLDKDLPDPKGPAFHLFVEKLKGLIERPPELTPKQFEDRVLESNVDPFRIPFKAFLNYPSRIKAALREEARKMAEATLRTEFQNGKVWVMLCGDPGEVAMAAESETDIPSANEIIQMALDKDRAPFQFSSPDSVDDFWSGHCMGPTTAKSYPTVTLQFERSRASQHFHFDTGSPISFFSFEELNELGLLDDQAFTTEGVRGSHIYEFISQSITISIFDQETSYKKKIKLRVRAVKGWYHSPFAARCHQTCERFDLSQRVNNCANRKGLVGRNLLSETGMALTIVGKDNKTRLADRAQRKLRGG